MCQQCRIERWGKDSGKAWKKKHHNAPSESQEAQWAAQEKERSLREIYQTSQSSTLKKKWDLLTKKVGRMGQVVCDKEKHWHCEAWKQQGMHCRSCNGKTRKESKRLQLAGRRWWGQAGRGLWENVDQQHWDWKSLQCIKIGSDPLLLSLHDAWYKSR